MHENLPFLVVHFLLHPSSGDLFHRILNPTITIEPGAVTVCNISPEEFISKQPKFGEIIPDLILWVRTKVEDRKCLFIAHDGSSLIFYCLKKNINNFGQKYDAWH